MNLEICNVSTNLAYQRLLLVFNSLLWNENKFRIKKTQNYFKMVCFIKKKHADEIMITNI